MTVLTMLKKYKQPKVTSRLAKVEIHYTLLRNALFHTLHQILLTTNYLPYLTSRDIFTPPTNKNFVDISN